MTFFFFALGLTLFFSGVYNCLVLSRKNVIAFLVAVEVMLLGLDILFIVSSLLFNNGEGLIMGVLILMLAVGESALGLGICITLLKFKKSVNFKDFNDFKN